MEHVWEFLGAAASALLLGMPVLWYKDPPFFDTIGTVLLSCAMAALLALLIYSAGYSNGYRDRTNMDGNAVAAAGQKRQTIMMDNIRSAHGSASAVDDAEALATKINKIDDDEERTVPDFVWSISPIRVEVWWFLGGLIVELMILLGFTPVKRKSEHSNEDQKDKHQ